MQYQTPVFCLTNTYQKRRFSKRPRIVTYIDGPFYPDGTLSMKQQKQKLRDEVYERMKERAGNSNVTVIRYEKEKEND